MKSIQAQAHPPDTSAVAGNSSHRRVVGVLLFVLAIAAASLAGWLLYRLEAGRVAEQHRQRETLRVAVLARLLRSELAPVADMLRVLADDDDLRNYVDTGSAAGLLAAIRQAQSISREQPDYDQIRFIDEQGREALRVVQGGRVVPREQLQDKSDRPYFRRALALAPDALYVSAFDLSVENGAVEVPYKPVLRFATPVFDSAGRRRGIYIINILGANLIEHLQQSVPVYSERVRVLNSGGFWLKALDPGQEWGFMVADRTGFALPQTDPAMWQQMQQQPAGQFDRHGGVFTWRRISLAELTATPADRLVSEEPYLIVGSEALRGEWQELFAGNRQISLFVTAGLAVLMLVAIWSLRARRRVVLELRRVNQDLEAHVRTRTAELAETVSELRNRESLLEETGRLARVGGWEFDPVTGQGSWTAEVARIHGLDPSVIPTRELGLQFYPGDSRQRLEVALQKSMADGSPYDLELEFISAQGEHKWVRTISRPVLQDGRVVRMRGAIQDITARKQSELRLHTQLRRMQLLERTTRAIGDRQDLESILQVVIQALEAQLPLDFGCICHFDAAARFLTVAAVGIASGPLAEKLDLAVGARISVEDNGLARCVMGTLVYEPDIAATPTDFTQRLASSGMRSLVVAPLQIESRIFGALIAARRAAEAFSSGECEFMRQLSEHVALAAHQAQLHGALQLAYEDLHNTQQAVMQQERLRVLGQMASGIAHDINNAISPIMLYTGSLLESEPGLSERARHGLLTIQQAVSDVAETVARMREFYRYRSERGAMQVVQLNPLVGQLPDLTRARWEAMPQQQGVVIELKVELAERLLPVRGIENEIREALVNLVFNAVDAMPAGGTLTLRTREIDAHRAAVEVIDTGAGMDEETRRRCMEPFFTTKGERGTGLGLAMVYGVMRRHDGDIEIDSALGRGTSVRLVFNMAEGGAAPVAHEEIAVPTGLAILLVDDDPILLRSLLEILELDGHLVRTANGGQKGIDAFQAALRGEGQPVDVVITDLGMPHVDGRAVAAAVKKAAPATPVIMLTGWGERLLYEEQVVPHVDRVLGKPPRLRELRQALGELALNKQEGGRPT